MKKTMHCILLLVLVLLLCTPVSASNHLKKTSVKMTVGNQIRLSFAHKTTSRIRWKSSNPSIAKVSSMGVVKARKVGTCTITARLKKKNYKCKVRVYPFANSVVLDQSSCDIKPFESIKLSATILPSNVLQKSVKWTSSDSSIATVNTKGVVIAKSSGTAVITASTTDGSKVSTSCTVNVLPVYDQYDITIQSHGTSINAQKFIDVLERYNTLVEKDAKAGNYWTYSNSGVKKTFQIARDMNNRMINCALMPSWALIDIGVLNSDQKFYGDLHGTIHYSSGAEKAIKSKCDVIKMDDTVTNLAARGKLKAGDILIYNFGEVRHTDVFIGYDAATRRYHFFEAGRNNSDLIREGSVYKFTTLKTTMSEALLSRWLCAYVIRVK